jgi:hypothetical protein
MNECLFWGKLGFENCTLLQKKALSAGKRALSAVRGVCAPPAPPGAAHGGIGDGKLIAASQHLQETK